MAVRDSGVIGATVTEERSWRWALWTLFLITVLRLVWLGLDRLDLYPDEAQYWLWSLHPALGYYSKPPLVAWLIAATTAVFGEDEFAVRLAAPLLHFATGLVIYAVGRRLYDARVAFWSAVAYATLPGVSASAVIMSTDAPLLLCWAVALYAFIRAREAGAERWWIAVGIAAGLGLLAKYAMAYWLLSALLYLLMFRDERRHLPRFFAAAGLAVLLYAPNLAWNAANGFVSYLHTRDNANLGGPLFHPAHLGEFFVSQFGVFGPILFAALVVMVLLARRSFAERRAALLAAFALPTLAIVLAGSFLSRAQANWAAPAYISAVVLVTQWLLARRRVRVLAVAVVLDALAAVAIFGAHDIAAAFGAELPAEYDPLHRLRGWKALGRQVSVLLAQHPGTLLLADDREDMAALVYYVHPHPWGALKWNGAGGIHDGFDLTAQPERDIGADFLLVTRAPGDTAPIFARFASVDPMRQRILIPLDRSTARVYDVYLLHGFKGYRPASAAAAPGTAAAPTAKSPPGRKPATPPSSPPRPAPLRK